MSKKGVSHLETSETLETTEATTEIYDFFISHSEAETKEAELLANMLKKINPKWNIFFDKDNLRSETDWEEKMFDAVDHSKHLIFLAKNSETLKFGHGWVFREVNRFFKAQTTNAKYGREHFNISYFGIMYDINLERDLFSDPNHRAKYIAAYESPNHMFLESGDTIADFEKTIEERTKNMTKDSVNHLPAFILDRVCKYASFKEETDENFSKERIIEDIIPYLSYDNEFLPFGNIPAIAIEKNFSIIGNEGGSGKTTIMTNLFFHFLEKTSEQPASESLIPIYIEASTLAGPDHLIMRNIAKNLYNEPTATFFDNTETINIISILEKEFSKDTKKPNYLLLIDGYNEIPENIRSKFDNEIKEYLNESKYKNVRVVISGRNVDEGIDDDVLPRYNIENLSVGNILRYIRKKGLHIKKTHLSSMFCLYLCI